MILTEALDRLFEWQKFNYQNRCDHIRPYIVGGISQTAFEAYTKSDPVYKVLVRNWLRYTPKGGEDGRRK